ncbi:MAG: hypothetical protein QW680_01325 [Pyrobaculum sp.]
MKRRGRNRISLIKQAAEIRHIVFHYRGPEDVARGVRRLLEGATRSGG